MRSSMTASSTTAEEKARLRRQVRAQLSDLSPEELRESDQALFEAFLALPQVEEARSLFLFWGSLGLDSSFDLVLVILGHISFTYPLVVRNLIGSIEEVDPAYEEVSMTLGAKPFQAFRKVLFPIIKSAVIAGGILAFTRSLGETGATTSISDTVNTVPIYITHLVEDGLYTEAAMCSIVLILICFIIMFGLRAITGRRSRRDA